MHTKGLAETMMSSRENLLSDELYSQYCNAFEQLMAIIESPNEAVDEDKLADVQYIIKKLERAFIDEQESLQDAISAERRRTRVNSAYLSTAKVIPFPGFNQKS
jgi:hypothetical protein